MKKLLLFILPFFCFAAFADSMSVFVNGNLTALKPSATNAVLITAKNYTDTQIQSIPAAHDFGPDIATASNAVLTASKTYADTKLPKAGGTMTGAINMGSKKITNLATPTSNADASTKQYVDNTVSSATAACIKDVSGSIYLEDSIYFLNENGGAVHSLALPDDGSDAANKDYVDITSNAVLASSKTYTDNAVSTKLSTSGGTMIGNVSFGDTYKVTNLKDPTSNADAATKRYVDNAKSSAISTASSDATTKSDAALANAKLYSQTNTLLEAKNFAGSQDVYVLSSAQNYADNKAAAARESANTYAKTYANTNTLVRAKSYTDGVKDTAYGFSDNLRLITGTGTGSDNPPLTPNNSSAYALDASRSKIALTNIVAGASLALFVDVNSPESTPVNATVQAGNARYCTVNFSGFPSSSGTVLFHLLVTCVNTADSSSPAVVKDFYLSYTSIPQ